MCWVVPDLARAIADWAGTAGIGPFFVFDQVRILLIVVSPRRVDSGGGLA
jgi:hypothetical protein